MATDRITERLERIIRERFGEPVVDPPEMTVGIADERDDVVESNAASPRQKRAGSKADRVTRQHHRVKIAW